MILLETVYARYVTYLMSVRFLLFAFVDIEKFSVACIKKSNWTTIKIYYGITQFCLFGSIGIVTITAFDRFLTIKSSNLSTRRFRYHLYSVAVLIFSGNALFYEISINGIYRADDRSSFYENWNNRLWEWCWRSWMQDQLEFSKVRQNQMIKNKKWSDSAFKIVINDLTSRMHRLSSVIMTRVPPTKGHDRLSLIS